MNQQGGVTIDLGPQGGTSNRIYGQDWSCPMTGKDGRGHRMRTPLTGLWTDVVFGFE